MRLTTFPALLFVVSLSVLFAPWINQVRDVSDSAGDARRLAMNDVLNTQNYTDAA
jgi:hypothetical protein